MTANRFRRRAAHTPIVKRLASALVVTETTPGPSFHAIQIPHRKVVTRISYFKCKWQTGWKDLVQDPGYATATGTTVATMGLYELAMQHYIAGVCSRYGQHRKWIADNRRFLEVRPNGRNSRPTGNSARTTRSLRNIGGCKIWS